jgi:hypothetical protein
MTRGSAIQTHGFIAPHEIDEVKACHPVNGVPGGVPAVTSTFVVGRKKDSTKSSQDVMIVVSEIRVKDRVIWINERWL